MSCNDVCSKLMFEGWTSQYSCTALPLGLNIYIEGTPYDPHLIFVGVYKEIVYTVNKMVYMEQSIHYQG